VRWNVSPGVPWLLLPPVIGTNFFSSRQFMVACGLSGAMGFSDGSAASVLCRVLALRWQVAQARSTGGECSCPASGLACPLLFFYPGTGRKEYAKEGQMAAVGCGFAQLLMFYRIFLRQYAQLCASIMRDLFGGKRGAVVGVRPDKRYCGLVEVCCKRGRGTAALL